MQKRSDLSSNIMLFFAICVEVYLTLRVLANSKFAFVAIIVAGIALVITGLIVNSKEGERDDSFYWTTQLFFIYMQCYLVLQMLINFKIAFAFTITIVTAITLIGMALRWFSPYDVDSRPILRASIIMVLFLIILSMDTSLFYQ